MQDNVLLREQIAIYESELRANMEQDRNVQALRHDMKHHIREIYSLADKNTDTDIIRYLVSGGAGQELQIEAVLEYIEGLLRIEVVNTFAGNVNKDGERFISHKGQGHGFGLFNVKKITEKYSGYMMTEHESNRFKVVVLLYL